MNGALRRNFGHVAKRYDCAGRADGEAQDRLTIGGQDEDGFAGLDH